MRFAVLGYSTPIVDPWDPSSCLKGLPGSEEAVVYATDALIGEGHSVDVYMNPPPDSPFENWFHCSLWNDPKNERKYDVVIMWRRFDQEEGRKRGEKVFFWGHDSPRTPYRMPIPQFDGLFLLSRHHVSQFQRAFSLGDIPVAICGNGIVPEHFPESKYRDTLKVGYFSNYSRGLSTLVKIWPDVLAKFPHATLEICYGRQTWGTMSEKELEILVEKISSLPGVTEHGMIGHGELSEIMSRCSVWAYPCNTDTETYCITAVKAQAAGLIPVTTRIGALDEMVSPSAPTLRRIDNFRDVVNYRDLLLHTLENVEEYDRKIFRDFALGRDWKSVVKSWLEIV